VPRDLKKALKSLEKSENRSLSNFFVFELQKIVAQKSKKSK